MSKNTLLMPNDIITYFKNNKDLMKRVVETEVDVSYGKEDYIITGKVDLLLSRDEKLELLDFKSQQKPVIRDPVIEKYKYQLHVYAHILKERYQKEPERLYIYWTAEDNRKVCKECDFRYYCNLREA